MTLHSDYKDVLSITHLAPLLLGDFKNFLIPLVYRSVSHAWRFQIMIYSPNFTILMFIEICDIFELSSVCSRVPCGKCYTPDWQTNQLSLPHYQANYMESILL